MHEQKAQRGFQIIHERVGQSINSAFPKTRTWNNWKPHGVHSDENRVRPPHRKGVEFSSRDHISLRSKSSYVSRRRMTVYLSPSTNTSAARVRAL